MPRILRYGGLEVTFHEGAVLLLAIEFEGLSTGALDLEGLSPQTTREEFEAFLRERNLSIRELVYEDPDGGALVRLDRASAAFEGGRLQSVQVSD